ncbi:MAG: hypothetical protein AB7N65_02560 [Vicinamibacterales bacterium]
MIRLMFGTACATTLALWLPAIAAPALAGAAPQRDNYYAAGETVDVTATVHGDAVVAGRTVTLSGPIEGDVLALGWQITLSAAAHDDVRLAGRRVQVSAPIAGDLTAAGGEILVEPTARVAGRAWLTGGVLHIGGSFERELRLAGGTVRLEGEFRQPVRVVAERLELAPGARLLSSLTYEGPVPAVVADGALVVGPTTYRAITEREAQDAHAFRLVSSAFFAIHLLLAGLLLLWLMPVTAANLVSTLASVPGRSALAGLGLLVGAPAVAVLLVLTLIGVPIGLAVGALYVVALLVGLLVAALRIGEWEAGVFRWTEMGSIRQRRLALVAGVLTLAALRVVPVLGTLVVLASIMCGLGALGLTAWQAARGQAAATA